MITKETAEKIVSCYQEIETGEGLLEKLEKPIEGTVNLLLDLGVLVGDRSRWLCKIRPGLALCITRAYTAEKKKELIEAGEKAKDELGLGGVRIVIPGQIPPG